MFELNFPVFQIFTDGTISKIHNPEILHKMNKKYVESNYWKNSIIIDKKSNAFELNDIKILKTKNYFNFYDLFYTTCFVELVLIEQKIDDSLIKRLKTIFKSYWSKIDTFDATTKIYDIISSTHDKQSYD